MACLNTLKLEIKTLERIFTKNHERFRILHASVDELTCRFVGKNGKNYDIHANITVIPIIFFYYKFILWFFLCFSKFVLQYNQIVVRGIWVMSCVCVCTELYRSVFCLYNIFYRIFFYHCMFNEKKTLFYLELGVHVFNCLVHNKTSKTFFFEHIFCCCCCTLRNLL